MKNKVISILVIMSMVISLCACEQDSTVENVGSTNSSDIPENVLDAEIEAFKSSSATNDTDLGLRNIKIDYAEGKLTEEQQLLIKYFSRDYMFVNSIEALQRYNNIFENALVEIYVNVAKIITYEDNSYELLVYMVENSNEYYTYDYMQDTRFMIIRGETWNGRFIQNDDLKIRGRFEGTENITVDGVSLYVPVINVHEGYLMEEDDSYFFYPSRFSMEEVKRVAKSIFGENITISNPPIEELWLWEGSYLCTLDNQSNAKFSRYYFSEREGTLYDASGNNVDIEFAADFQHFFLFIYDEFLETLTLEYYDKDLKLIWKREFEDTTSATYDFTKNNVYLSANNRLYIINIDNGEDTYESTFIGEKAEIRKFNNGILTVAYGKSDAFVYTNLLGEIVWTLNATNDISYVSAIQEVEGNIVIKVFSSEYDNMGYWVRENEYYYVIDMENGSLLYEGTVDLVPFHQYS